MRYRAEDLCRLGFLFTDLVAIFSALVLAYYVRFDFLGRVLPPEALFAPTGGGGLASYIASIVFGGVLLLLILFLNGAYENRTLLRFRRSFFLLFRSLLVWVIVFSGVSLILEFNERLSRVYVVISFGLLFAFLVVSRFAVQRFILSTGITGALRQRILFVDWTDKTSKIAQAALRDRWNPYKLVGCAPNAKNRFTCRPPPEIPFSAAMRKSLLSARRD
jgi:FlaA1/EpsC-like NDP-sugar epimerase